MKSLFRKKKKNGLFLFNYTPDLTNYRLFPQQPPEVKAVYRFCKISMAVCIPLFTLISFFSFFLSAFFLLVLWFTTFHKIRQKYGFKAALVPIFCSLSGILFGSVFFRYLLTPQEVPIAR
jgi:FtsH-binding integral membrane protein